MSGVRAQGVCHCPAPCSSRSRDQQQHPSHCRSGGGGSPPVLPGAAPVSITTWGKPFSESQESQGHSGNAKRCRQTESLLHPPLSASDLPRMVHAASLQRCPKARLPPAAEGTSPGDSAHPTAFTKPVRPRGPSDHQTPHTDHSTVPEAAQENPQTPHTAGQVHGNAVGERCSRTRCLSIHPPAGHRGSTERPCVP